jgi:hypothetical protein
MSRKQLFSILAALFLPFKKSQAAQYLSDGSPAYVPVKPYIPSFKGLVTGNIQGYCGMEVLTLFGSDGQPKGQAIYVTDKNGILRRFILEELP